jgi:hypothetical protein
VLQSGQLALSVGTGGNRPLWRFGETRFELRGRLGLHEDQLFADLLPSVTLDFVAGMAVLVFLPGVDDSVHHRLKQGP